MKLPFDFGARFVLRLLLPSVILALALFPLAAAARHAAGVKLADEILFTATGLLAGFAMLLLDMPIYMLLEGRRFWPGWLRRWGIGREQRRLARLQALSTAATDPALQVEYDIQIAEFPIDKATGDPKVVYPTRLGNILTGFETYPDVKYGLDGVFFWPRLWLSIDKDLREELDGVQAVVDGTVYACFALIIAALMSLLYTLLLLPDFAWQLPALALGALLLSYGCYRASLSPYVQYGALFAAAFDQYRDRLVFGTVVADLDRHMGVAVAQRSERERSRAVWRFLRWHRYRRPGAAANERVTNWLR